MDFDDLWDYDDPEATEQKFRGLLPSATGEASYYAQLLTQIARAQGLQRKFDEAHRTLDETQSLLTDDLAQARIRYLLERGRVFNSSKHREQARPLFLEAWEQAATAGEDFYAIDAAHMLGIVEPPEQSLEWNLKALALAETTQDKQAQNWRGSLYNNIGWTYHDSGQYEKALDLFEKALRWREAQGQLPQTRIAKWCVARTLRSLGRLEEALASQQALLAEHENAGGKDGYVYEELGECLLALNQQEKARPYFALAYDELSKDPWLADNEPARLARLKQLGRELQ